MSDQEYYGKEDEKQAEKQGEKEQGWDEKWRRDPLSAVVWAAILIWVGVMLLLGNIGVLDNLRIQDQRLEPWSLGMLGAGAIVLLEALIRLVMPAYRRRVGGSLVFAAILIGVGLGDILGWELVGPLILIAIGISTLIGGLVRRR